MFAGRWRRQRSNRPMAKAAWMASGAPQATRGKTNQGRFGVTKKLIGARDDHRRKVNNQVVQEPAKTIAVGCVGSSGSGGDSVMTYDWLAARRKSRIRSGSLWPGRSSTPELTSIERHR